MGAFGKYHLIRDNANLEKEEEYEIIELNDREFAKSLRAKLQNEVRSFLTDSDIIHLAEISEIIAALAKCSGKAESALLAQRALLEEQHGVYTEQKAILYKDDSKENFKDILRNEEKEEIREEQNIKDKEKTTIDFQEDPHDISHEQISEDLLMDPFAAKQAFYEQREKEEVLTDQEVFTEKPFASQKDNLQEARQKDFTMGQDGNSTFSQEDNYPTTEEANPVQQREIFPDFEHTSKIREKSFQEKNTPASSSPKENIPPFPLDEKNIKPETKRDRVANKEDRGNQEKNEEIKDLSADIKEDDIKEEALLIEEDALEQIEKENEDNIDNSVEDAEILESQEIDDSLEN